MKEIFIAGTDTGIGKTHITCALLRSLNNSGYTTLASKPIASGCEMFNNQLRNDDALKLQCAASIAIDYNQVNPACFESAIAPHIAAQQQHINIQADFFEKHLEKLRPYQADYHLIEGAGGWHTPINKHETYGDLVAKQRLGVILVVGIKLGCINHCLLTVDAISRSPANLIGWIANCIDPEMLCISENILSIQQRINVPLLTTLSYSQTSINIENLPF